MERRVVPVGAVVLTTFFALLYALRGSIAALDRGEDPRWAQQVGWSLAMWWTLAIRMWSRGAQRRSWSRSSGPWTRSKGRTTSA